MNLIDEIKEKIVMGDLKYMYSLWDNFRGDHEEMNKYKKEIMWGNPKNNLSFNILRIVRDEHEILGKMGLVKVIDNKKIYIMDEEEFSDEMAYRKAKLRKANEILLEEKNILVAGD